MLAVIAVVVAAGLALLFLRYPRISVPRQLPPASAEDVSRGRYLFEAVLACHDCHSDHDWRFYGGPVIRGTAGRGAWVADQQFPTWSRNITPHGLGAWSDGEIFRAITEGVDRNGRPLHPLMPSDSYREMVEEDVRAVVAYLRTLPPIRHDPPRWKARSVVEFLVVRVVSRILPRPYESPTAPSRSDSIRSGKYLVKMAECTFCHRSDFSGGRQIRIGTTRWVAVSSNITPEPTTGIGKMTREEFLAVFRSFRTVSENPIAATTKNTPMPWLRYHSMTDEDLGAIYDYLRTVPSVVKHEADPSLTSEPK